MWLRSAILIYQVRGWHNLCHWEQWSKLWFDLPPPKQKNAANRYFGAVFWKKVVSLSIPAPPYRVCLWERTRGHQGHLPLQGLCWEKSGSAERGGDLTHVCMDGLAGASLRLLLVPDSKLSIAPWKVWVRLSEVLRICTLHMCFTRWLTLTGEWECLVLAWP